MHRRTTAQGMAGVAGGPLALHCRNNASSCLPPGMSSTRVIASMFSRGPDPAKRPLAKKSRCLLEERGARMVMDDTLSVSMILTSDCETGERFKSCLRPCQGR